MNLSRSTPIGVDLSGRWMKAAQLSRRPGRGWKLRAACRVERSNPSGPVTRADIDALLAAAVRQGCDGDRIVLGAPPQLTVCSSLDLPARSSGAPIAQIARLELARTARITPESFEMAMWDVPPPGRGGDGTFVVAVGLAHANAETLLSLFDDTGFDVECIDARACGLGRAAGLDPSGASLLIDIGWDHTSLSMLLGGRVLYERVLADTSLAALYRQITARCGLDQAAIDTLLLREFDGDEATAQSVAGAPLRAPLNSLYDSLSTEIARSVAYAAHRYLNIPIASVILCGDGAMLPGLAARISTPECPARTHIPGELVELGPDARRWSRCASLIAALGLAIPAAAGAKEAA